MEHLSILKSAFKRFLQDEPFQKAAAVSYFTLLSLAPLLLVLMAVTGIILSQEAIQRELMIQIRSLVGPQGAETVALVMENAARPAQSYVSLVIGVISLFIGATTVFIQIQTALNQIFGDPEEDKKTRSIFRFLKKRIFSFAVILGIGFLLLVSLILSSVIAALSGPLKSLFPGMPIFISLADIIGSIFLITLLVAMMFKFLPTKRLSWSHLWPGSLLTSILFTVGKYFIGLYLGHASIGSTFGAAGSVVVFMVWVYYATIIILYGAEVTYIYTEKNQGGFFAKFKKSS